MRSPAALVLLGMLALARAPGAETPPLTPTVLDARHLLEQRIADQAEGRIRLTVFTSADGPKPAPWDNDGEGRFLDTYQAEIVFSEPCLWAAQFEDRPVTFKTFKSGALAPVPNRVFAVSQAGERFTLRGQIAFKGSSPSWEATGFFWSDPPERMPALGSEAGSVYPKDLLENDTLKVHYYLPDGSKGYYRGTRFDWSGLISRVEYAGHSFFSEFKREHDPLNHDDICGTAEEFGISSPAGYAQAASGGTFLKVGVGLLVKPDNEAYRFDRRYPIAQEGQWEVHKRPYAVEFRQEFTTTGGWGYTYIKTLEIPPRTAVLKVRRALTNTGQRPITTDHYCHNFLKIDDTPAGPDYRMEFPFAPRFGEGSRPQGCVELQDHTLQFRREVPAGESVWVRLEGFKALVDNLITVRNQRTGASLAISTDQMPTRMAFYTHDGVLSPEPFVAVQVAPGVTQSWTTTYTFAQTTGH